MCRSIWKDVSVTTLAKDLHILRVKFRISYKISLTVFKCLPGNAPDYLKELITLSKPSCSLRTVICINRLEPPAMSKCVKMSHTFEHCAISVWNDLPPSIPSKASLPQLKSCLKAHYFDIAYKHARSFSLNIAVFNADCDIIQFA